MKCLFFLLLLIQGFKAFVQDLPSETQIYEFINTAIFPAGEKPYNLSARSSVRFLTENQFWMNDSVFSEADMDYFRKQLVRIESFQWKKNKVNGTRIISGASIKRSFRDRKNGWTKFGKKYGNCLSRFSMPVFNLDGMYCVIQAGTQCDWLNGGGSVKLYKKTERGWEFVKEYMIWVS